MRISDWSSDVCSSDLVGYTTRERLAAESSMKYVLFGAVCSAVMLYGISLLYGLTGTLQLNSEFTTRLAATDALAAGLALFTTLAGFGFKLSMFPFHFWVADVYEGSTNSRSEEHTSELQSLMRSSYAVFCLKKKK